MEGSLVAYKVFTNGSVLNASEINDNLMNQSVMVFSNSTARAAALTAPVEGMLTWLEDVNRYEYRNGAGAWVSLLSSPILQIVQAVKADTFTTTSTSFTAVTGLSATITPSSATSKILVTTMVPIGVAGGGSLDRAGFLTVFRGATNLSNPTSSGSRSKAFHGQPNIESGRNAQIAAVSFLDSPATTSATTYEVRVMAGISETVFINRATNDTDAASQARMVSTITLTEVAG
jgi:hypothetical protein